MEPEMVRRTITDDEIALIKAMVERGMKNRDIQFFFNRPDRAVNSGRITGIGDGTYSNSVAIARASDDEVEAFFEVANSVNRYATGCHSG